MTVDPYLLADWERAGLDAFNDGQPRNRNPAERRNRPRAEGPTHGVEDANWIAKRDAWWRGWDNAFARTPRSAKG